MDKKSIQIKENEGPESHEISKPQWSDLETAKIITELADLYGIEYELKIDKNMNKNEFHETFKTALESRKDLSIRTKTKFLFFPKTIDGKTKWLTKASWYEEFKSEIDQEALDLGSTNILTFVWKPIKWIE